MTAAAAKIDRQRCVALFQMMQRRNMGGRKIGHMDEVALTCSVGRRIIGAENPQRRRVADCGIDGEWDQVSLGIMALRELAVGVRPASVEVSKYCGAEAMRLRNIVEDLLANSLD